MNANLARRGLLVGAAIWSCTNKPTIANDGIALNFPGAEPAWDLPDLPVGVSILQWAGLKLRDALLERQYTTEMAALETYIRSELSNPSVGYLIKVAVYADGAGTIEIPGGQMIYPIGGGSEPLDALAEHLRKPRAELQDLSGLRNLSTYVWYRQSSGRLVGTALPGEWRRDFEQSALREANRRDILADQGGSEAGIQGVLRATFWTEVAQARLKDLRTDAERRRVNDLTREFAAAEEQFNKAYRNYVAMEADYVRQRTRAAAVDRIIAVTSLLQQAVSTGALVSSSSGNPTTAKSQPMVDATADKADAVGRMQAIMDYLRQSVPEINERGERLKKLDIDIRSTYEGSGVRPPSAAPLLPPSVQVPGPP